MCRNNFFCARVTRWCEFREFKGVKYLMGGSVLKLYKWIKTNAGLASRPKTAGWPFGWDGRVGAAGITGSKPLNTLIPHCLFWVSCSLCSIHCHLKVEVTAFPISNVYIIQNSTKKYCVTISGVKIIVQPDSNVFMLRQCIQRSYVHVYAC